MFLGRINLDDIRDCVREALLTGADRGQEFRTMRHAIIAELKRLGHDSSEIKDALIEWNKRCERVLGPGEDERQLFDYVDWADKRECRIGCNALKDYCIGEESCQFHRSITRRKRAEVENIPFDINELETYLTDRFKAEAYVMMLIVRALRRYQQEKATGEVMFIGFQKLSSIIRDNDGYNLLPMQVFRIVQALIDEGIIERVEKGKKGTFSRLANGYRFLPWRGKEYP